MNDSPSGSSTPRNGGADSPSSSSFAGTVRDWFRNVRRGRNGDSSVREAIEELIEEREEAEIPFDTEERRLLENILRLRDRTVDDVMVPRADIIAVEREIPLDQTMEMMARQGHSRVPVYRETLDDVMGMLHIKDVVHPMDSDLPPALDKLVRPVLFVAPSMRVLDLLLEMRTTRVHMALVVDEYGGTDGLVTIEDLVEEIVGEIEDEHDVETEPQLKHRADGTFEADARYFVEDFEAVVGPVLSDEEREDIDTLGGLVFSVAGRVPLRGELLHHPAGLEFEITDADPRRIRRLIIRGPRIDALNARDHETPEDEAPAAGEGDVQPSRTAEGGGS